MICSPTVNGGKCISKPSPAPSGIVSPSPIILIPGQCSPEVPSCGSLDFACVQINDQIWLCQDKNLIGARPCSKFNNDPFQDYYSNGLTINVPPICQVKSGLTTGWVVEQQKCVDGDWVDINVNRLATTECPALYSCNNYDLNNQNQANRFIADECCDRDWGENNQPAICFPTKKTSSLLDYLKGIFINNF